MNYDPITISQVRKARRRLHGELHEHKVQRYARDELGNVKHDDEGNPKMVEITVSRYRLPCGSTPSFKAFASQHGFKKRGGRWTMPSPFSGTIISAIGEKHMAQAEGRAERLRQLDRAQAEGRAERTIGDVLLEQLQAG